MRRPHRGRQFLTESRYSLSAYSSPPHRVAANCATQRAARAQPSAAGKPQSAFPPEEQAQPKARPSSPPRVRLTAAPLSLRHCRRPRQFLPDWPNANRQNMPFKAGGRRSFCTKSSFSRALGNLVKTRKRILTISLFRRGARLYRQEGTALTPGGPHVPWTGETTFRYGSLNPNNTLQPITRPHHIHSTQPEQARTRRTVSITSRTSYTRKPDQYINKNGWHKATRYP